MDPKAFIESGILEAYVLGHCTPDEAEDVERMVASHPEVRDELTAIEQALETYASANATAAPAGLKERILDRIEYERTGSGPVTQPVAAPTPAPPAPMAPVATGSTALLQFGLAGLALATALAAFMVWQAGQENRRLQEERNALRQQVAECETRSQDLDHLRQQIAFLRDPDITNFRLIDPNNRLEPVLVFHHHSLKKMRIDVASLPTPEGQRKLQLWSIVGGVPQSLGLLEKLPGDDGWKLFDVVPQAEAYAISAELEEVQTPTADQVLAVGG
jgi:anti-sigma-K factor RskA